MKYKILSLCLLVALVHCGVTQKQKCKPDKTFYRFEFKNVYFNNELGFSFLMRSGDGSYKMKSLRFLEKPKIIHDIEKSGNNYFIGEIKRMSIGGNRYRNAEIHLKPTASISPGAENRGKFGLYPWSEVK